MESGCIGNTSVADELAAVVQRMAVLTEEFRSIAEKANSLRRDYDSYLGAEYQPRAKAIEELRQRLITLLAVGMTEMFGHSGKLDS